MTMCERLLKVFRRKNTEKRVLSVLPENVVEIIDLADICNGAGPGVEHSFATYNLWKRINELFPETEIGNWRLSFNDPRCPLILEH